MLHVVARCVDDKEAMRAGWVDAAVAGALSADISRCAAVPRHSPAAAYTCDARKEVSAMNRWVAVGLGGLLGALASCGPALADPAWCEREVVGSGRIANGLNFDPPRHYDTQAVARQRAIAAWRDKVGVRCPHHSTFWWRAHGKSVDCEGYAGGIECEVRAVPARKLLSFGATR
jgi:hypothetical protein